MLNGLQLAVHLPLFNLLFPANASLFIEFVISMATFDLLPPEVTLSLFDFPESQEPYSEGFDLAGYSSMYPVENLGTCWLLVQLYCLLVVLWLLLKCINHNCSWQSLRLRRVQEKIGQFAFWGAALRFLFQGYLELCLSVFIGWYEFHWSGRNMSVQYSNIFMIAFTAILLAFPIWIPVFFYLRRSKLNPDAPG